MIGFHVFTQTTIEDEKYIGNVMLQKTFTLDLLTGKQVKNIGQMDRFYVHGAHEGIVRRELFEKVS